MPVGNEDVERLVSLFLSGKSPHTLRAYRQDLESFAEQVGDGDLANAVARLLRASHGEANALALEYRARMVSAWLSANTVNRRLAALRSLVTLARTIGLVPWRLEVKNVEARPYRDTRGPRREGFLRLLGKLEDRCDAKGARDRAMLRLMYDLALRRSEVVGLDTEDLDLDRQVLAVRGKRRTAKEPLSLPEQTSATLRVWLQHRGTHPGPLFLNLDHANARGRLSASSLTRLIKRLGSDVGLRVTPHGLRHAAIADALDLSNGDVRAVQRFSRHRDPKVLLHYDDNRVDLGGAVAALVAAAAHPSFAGQATPTAPEELRS